MAGDSLSPLARIQLDSIDLTAVSREAGLLGIARSIKRISHDDINIAVIMALVVAGAQYEYGNVDLAIVDDEDIDDAGFISDSAFKRIYEDLCRDDVHGEPELG